MTQVERRKYLLGILLSENVEYNGYEIPNDEEAQKKLLRALFNVRMPKEVSSEFLKIQDEYLQEEIRNKGITDIDSLETIKENIYLWRGDITTIRCDAIVNAANSQLLGCFYPNHGCIDNAIHTFAGVELRLKCNDIMKEQGHPEKTGQAKLTPAYNLPSNYIIHTVGPIVRGTLTMKEINELKSCYISCLKLALHNNIGSIAFCCISTGEFGFPQDRAAEIAVNTVEEFMTNTDSEIKVIFNVYKKSDYEIYKRILT